MNSAHNNQSESEVGFEERWEIRFLVTLLLNLFGVLSWITRIVWDRNETVQRVYDNETMAR